jgi:uncharacterized protein (UPF0332 family)
MSISHRAKSLADQLRATVHEMWRISNSDLAYEEALNRRIISTAYYAVFRLVVDEGLDLIFANAPMKSNVVKYYSGLFRHKLMVAVFNCYANENKKIKKDIAENELLYTEEMLEKVNQTGLTILSHYQIKTDLVLLAKKYVRLYDERIKADYQTDNGKDYDYAFMRKVLDEMDEFFNLWQQLNDNSPETLIKIVWLMLHWEKLRN